MNTLLIWIFLPFLIGIILLFLKHKQFLVLGIGLFLTLALSISASLIKVDEIVLIGSQSYPLINQIRIAGLEFLFTNASRPILILLYGFLAIFYSGAPAARTDQNFIPTSLIIVPFIILGVSVKPIIFGFMFFQPAVFLCAFLLTPPGSQPIKSVFRFLAYQVMGMTFFLLAIWSLSANPDILENPSTFLRTFLIFWLGFSFIFAIFPVHTWVPMVAEKAHPYKAIFIFSALFGGYSFLMSSIYESYHWFFEEERITQFLFIASFILIITGGIGALNQRNLGHLLGYAVIIEVGYGLLALTLRDTSLFYVMLVPRALALFLWSLGLSIIREHTPDLSTHQVIGKGRLFPVASSAIIFAQFSLSGVPLLAGFPLLLVLWQQVANYSAILALSSFLGSIGLLVGSLRSFSSLITIPDEPPKEDKEDIIQLVFLIAGLVILFLLGIFPHWIVRLFTSLF